MVASRLPGNRQTRHLLEPASLRGCVCMRVPQAGDNGLLDAAELVRQMCREPYRPDVRGAPLLVGDREAAERLWQRRGRQLHQFGHRGHVRAIGRQRGRHTGGAAFSVSRGDRRRRDAGTARDARPAHSAVRPPGRSSTVPPWLPRSASADVPTWPCRPTAQSVPSGGSSRPACPSRWRLCSGRSRHTRPHRSPALPSRRRCRPRHSERDQRIRRRRGTREQPSTYPSGEQRGCPPIRA